MINIPGISFDFYLALTAGMLAAFNPCGVVLLPAYISYLMSHETENYSKINLTFFGLKIGLLMSSGFLTVFIIVGIIISLAGTYIVHYAPWITVVIGILLFLMGIILLLKSKNIFSIPSISRLGPMIQQKNKYNYYLYGLGYAIISLGCTLPIFMVVVFTSINMGNFYEGITAFFIYGLGMSIVITLLTILSLYIKSIIEKWIRKIVPFMQKIAAIFIIFTGAYLVFYWLWGPGQLLH